jgi:hypothetical protein
MRQVPEPDRGEGLRRLPRSARLDTATEPADRHLRPQPGRPVYLL